MTHYVYILQSLKDKQYYTGLTNNIERRLQEHNSGRVTVTKSRKPFRIVYSERTENLKEARTREKFFKSGAGREFRDSILKK